MIHLLTLLNISTIESLPRPLRHLNPHEEFPQYQHTQFELSKSPSCRWPGLGLSSHWPWQLSSLRVLTVSITVSTIRVSDYLVCVNFRQTNSVTFDFRLHGTDNRRSVRDDYTSRRWDRSLRNSFYLSWPWFYGDRGFFLILLYVCKFKRPFETGTLDLGTSIRCRLVTYTMWHFVKSLNTYS